MAYDLVIRNGTVVDGSGLGSYRADVGVVGDRIAFVGRIRDRGATRDRRRRSRGHARLHRRPHAHGRAGVLGRQREQLVLARRDDRRDGQLRLHARAGARRRRARWSCGTSNGPRTSTRLRWPKASTGAWRHFPSTSTRSTRCRRASTSPRTSGTRALRTWAMGERAFETEANDDDLALDDAATRRRRSVRARSGSRRHAASTTRHPTTGPSPRGSRRGTRSCGSSA